MDGLIVLAIVLPIVTAGLTIASFFIARSAEAKKKDTTTANSKPTYHT